MISLPKEIKNKGKTTFPTLKNDTETDVVIVGGGITGLTTAYLLYQVGLRVIVLEKNNISSGTTGSTTGKVTSQHNIKYADLYKRLGKAVTQDYAQANQLAIDEIENIIQKEKIDCDWNRADNYVYTTQPQQVTNFKKEAEVAAGLGLPATFETNIDLPFEITGAVRFSNQAKFQAKDFVRGLANVLNNKGHLVYENSEATGFHDGEPCWVKTKKAKIKTKHIVVATKVPASPLVARLSYCAYEFPTTSYIVAGKAKNAPKHMYISPDKNHYSILPISGLLLVGGENHLPIKRNHTSHYQKLADYAQLHFGVEHIDYMWRALDYLSYDEVPLIGKVYPWSNHMYTATAFQKWGLSTGWVAASILRDAILGQPNPWSYTFRTNRLKTLLSAPRIIKLL